ncbi:MAG: hypothetical protein AAF581_09080 [Planctomycetota bacterium]
MPSSTSNSSAAIASGSSSQSRAPEGPWGRTWLVGVIVACVLLGAWELTLRSAGHPATLVDDMSLWSQARERVATEEPNTIVLLGASRILLAASTETIAAECPGHSVVMLAISGRQAVASLADLANDDSFRGIVVCSVSAASLSARQHRDQKAYLDFYATQWNLNHDLNRRIATAVQSNLAMVHPNVNLREALFDTFKNKHFPKPFYLQAFADRSHSGDYSMVDLTVHRQRRLQLLAEGAMGARRVPVETWLEDARHVAQLAAKIEARGGRVAFVRLPTTGEHWEFDSNHFPRGDYWDRWAALPGGGLKLHFLDVPEMTTFDCPDGSHIDTSDRAQFTLILIQALRDRGLFDR